MRNKRAGFTLVELMVAMALTLFIMVILSQAFVLALETFAGMKGIGDMQINLRTAASILRDDLGQDHFEGKRRLSDLNAAGQPQIVLQPPQAGFFAVLQGSAATATAPAPYLLEGNDTNNVGSYRAVDHILYFTVKRRGNQPQNFFTTSLVGTSADLTTFFGQNTAYDVPPSVLTESTLALPYNGSSPAYYSGQWAEIVYYLVRTGSTEEPLNPASALGTPIYGLYRAQFVMVPDGTNVSNQASYKGRNLQGPTAAPNLPTFAGLSCDQNSANAPQNANDLVFFSPADAAAYVTPANAQTQIIKRLIPRLQQFQPNAAPTPNIVSRVHQTQTATLVLPNVVSFQVQVMATNSSVFTDIGSTGLPPVGAAAQSANLFDTSLFTYNGYGNNAGLKAIQVTMRVWDTGTRQTRQVTVGQDL